MSARFRHRQAMSLIEVVLAAFILVLASLILFRAFTANKRLAVQNRNRTAAQLLIGNLFEEIQAHPYGLPAPKDWPPDKEPGANWQSAGFPEVQEIPAYVEGKVQKMVFHRRLSYEGSMVGNGTKNYDLATVTIQWSESGHKGLKELSAQLLVRRR